MGKYAVIFLILLFPSLALAYSPVARFDVVPYQRIEYGASLNVGVAAFSKPGIASVDFVASGQGYSGGTKTATSMTLNSTTDTWEYWVNFPASEFTGNGAITITATVTDNEANERVLTLSLLVYGASAFTPVTAWVDPAGNNTTCMVNDEGAPCLTVAGAITKIQAANGGVSDGAIIYLEEGTYSVASTSASTSSQWLTITKDDTAAVANVIINTGQITTGYLKYDSVTLQSLGSALYVANSSSTRLWTNSCRRIGSGRGTVNTNPVHLSDENNHYSTNDYTYDADYAYRKAALVRGATISFIGNDVFENTPFIVNCTADDVDNIDNPSWHADAFQTFTGTTLAPPDNRIVYNYKATDLHYEAIFMRSDTGTATDNAFVNVFLEMRDPCTVNETGSCVFTDFQLYYNWDHLIMWNNTFIGGHSTISPTSTLTNVSWVGNVFWQFAQDTDISNLAITQLANGNAGGNEVLYNHYEYVKLETGECTPNSKFTQAGYTCPKNYTKRPDSGATATYSTGGGVTDGDYTSETFTYPVGDTLTYKFSPRVPVDIYNVARGTLSSIGAVEPVFSGPVRSAGAPSSTVSYAATTTISLFTATTATCKYGTVAETDYSSIANTFESTASQWHTQTGVAVSPGTNTFYVRCTDGSHENLTDYVISFNMLSQSSARVGLSLTGTGKFTPSTIGTGKLIISAP